MKKYKSYTFLEILKTNNGIKQWNQKKIEKD